MLYILCFCKRYAAFCSELCGQMLHRNADAVLDERKKRLDAARIAYQTKFEREPSGEAWDEPRGRGVKREREEEEAAGAASTTGGGLSGAKGGGTGAEEGLNQPHCH